MFRCAVFAASVAFGSASSCASFVRASAAAWRRLTAFLRALAAAHPGARLLICGSLYLAGEVLGASQATWPD